MKTTNVKVGVLGSKVTEYCLDPNENPTVATVLELAEIEDPAEGGLYLNGESATEASQLRDGDIVNVVPKVGAGR